MDINRANSQMVGPLDSVQLEGGSREQQHMMVYISNEHNQQNAGQEVNPTAENMLNSVDSMAVEDSTSSADVDMDKKEPIDEEMSMKNSPDIDMAEQMSENASVPEMIIEAHQPSTIEMIDSSLVDATSLDAAEVVKEVAADCSQPAVIDEVPVTAENSAVDSCIYEDATFEHEIIIELSRHSWERTGQNYVRGCTWSPDGTCILVPVNRDGMHVFELPTDLYGCDTVSPNTRPVDVLQSAIHIREGGTIYDYCWYPFMNSAVPASCCWLTTRQHGPIQMFDAFDGALRCTYRGYDAVDEVEAALSVCFSTDGQSVIGGYRKSLKLFRTNLPGREFTNFPLKCPASCFAVNVADENVLAIGSWNGTIALHDVRTAKLDETARFGAGVHRGGVTMIRFAPPTGVRLWSGARKDGRLVCWDARDTRKPLMVLRRTVATNQRIQFDVSRPQGRWLCSGDTDGVVRVWDLMEQDGIAEYKVHTNFMINLI